MPETLEYCQPVQSCGALTYETERAEDLRWRGTPEDLARVFDGAESCEALVVDLSTICR